MKIAFVFLFSIFIPLVVVATGGQAVNDKSIPQCSEVIHNNYTVIGPNGQSYATWHPQIDLSNWCYFDHEHGSSPHLLWPNGGKPKYQPLYGYSMPSEGHNGFKTYVINLDANHRLMLTHHFGTANVSKAVCTRYHTFDVMIIDSNTGELLADVHMMGDFGAPVVNETNAIIDNPDPLCDDDFAGSNGTRQFPAEWLNNIGYEPWRVHRHHNIDINPKANQFGFDSAAVAINTRNPKTACTNAECTQSSQRIDPGFNTQSNGTWRSVEFSYPGFGFTGVVSGTFVIDGLVQYIKPNWSYRSPAIKRCWPTDPFVYNYICQNIGIDASPFYRNQFVTGAN